LDFLQNILFIKKIVLHLYQQKQLNMKALYKIGQKFMYGGKVKRSAIVVDVLRTYNSKNELVKVSYVTESKVCGITATNHETSQTTISRGKF